MMNLKGLKRNEQAVMLEHIGLDPQTALRDATAGVTLENLVAERMQGIRQQSICYRCSGQGDERFESNATKGR